MRRNLTAGIACLVVFCAADFVWLGVLARDFYGSRLGGLLLAEPNWMAAALFYPLYVCGLCVFCVAPARAAGSWRKGFGLGALLRLVGRGHARRHHVGHRGERRGGAGRLCGERDGGALNARPTPPLRHCASR